MEKTPSRTSPKNSKRGCLCPDNTYSVDCCDGSLQAQGVGNVGAITVVYSEVENNGVRTITRN